MSLYQGFYAIVVFWRKTCQAEIMMDRQGKLMKSMVDLIFLCAKLSKVEKAVTFLLLILRDYEFKSFLLGTKILKKMFSACPNC